jgi:hypothetical protein
MFESDEKITFFVKDTLIKMFNKHRDSKKTFFQIKVPVLETLQAYEIVYKKPITIGSPDDEAIVKRFEKSVNDGMDQFEQYCLQKTLKIKKVRLDDALYFEYDARPKKPVKQEKTLKMVLKGNKITFKDLDRLYDCASEFNIRISTEQVKEILEENPSIAHGLFQWGNDTVVGDNFYKAFVEKVSGMRYKECKEKFKDDFYKEIERLAVSKGYQQQD